MKNVPNSIKVAEDLVNSNPSLFLNTKKTKSLIALCLVKFAHECIEFTKCDEIQTELQSLKNLQP